MKVSELLRLLHEDGWKQVRMKGSHRQFRHPSKAGTVTVAGKPRYTARHSIEHPQASWAKIAKARKHR